MLNAQCSMLNARRVYQSEYWKLEAGSWKLEAGN